MRRLLTFSAILIAAWFLFDGCRIGARVQASAGWKWSFDSDSVGKAPRGFSFDRTGKGKQGIWVVQTEKDAPSAPNVLAQIDPNSTNYRFPVAVANEPAFRNGKVSVRCKALSGKVDQACGLLFRYRNENNYYVARANALEDNVNLYRLQNGRRREIKSWRGNVTNGVWHELAIAGKGDRLSVLFDGKKIIEANDKTFTDAGKIGLWTKADSVTYFDDLNAIVFP